MQKNKTFWRSLRFFMSRKAERNELRKLTGNTNTVKNKIVLKTGAPKNAIGNLIFGKSATITIYT